MALDEKFEDVGLLLTLNAQFHGWNVLDDVSPCKTVT